MEKSSALEFFSHTGVLHHSCSARRRAGVCSGVHWSHDSAAMRELEGARCSSPGIKFVSSLWKRVASDEKKLDFQPSHGSCVNLMLRYH